ncbi:T9SS type A sorting domain-containing protein [candidate division WOR-3 bacterium]|nr:T9SS type A sorting domain-containing protein [candidate division WOR-3 bacterium]
MQKILLLGGLMVLVSALGAADIPLDPNSVILTGSGGTQVQQDVPDMRVAIPVGTENNPFYHSLEVLTRQEKDNAFIEIMFMEPVSQEIENYARTIEETWNGGDFEQALNMFDRLNTMPGVAGNAVIGITWRTPRQSPLSDWGNDVLISARDSVFVLAMDHDMTTHNLFAMIGFTGDGMGSKYTANFSSNGGLTWSETYTLGGFTFVMNDLDACCVSNHFYVAYTGGPAAAPNTMAWLKRFHIATGQPDTMPNGSSTYNILTTSEIMDVDISSNHEQTGLNNRLYFYCIENAGTIRNFWNAPTTVTWTEITTGINNAQQGLDTDWNLNYTSYSSIMSFITDADSVEIYGRSGTSWVNLWTYYIINTPWPDWTTAIGGHNDTIFCAFSYDGTYMQVRYLVNYGGATWYYGFLAPDTMVSNWCADVTLRGSGGIHGAYRGPSIYEAYYRNRGYSGGWSTPVQYNDHNASGEVRPQIEFVGNGNYGILYREPMASGGKCYFDRSDWTGIVEHKVDDAFGRYVSLAPNPAHNTSVLSFVTQQDGRVAITLYDAAGRLAAHLMDGQMNAGNHSVNIDAQKLPAGIYFVRVETPDGTSTKTMTIVR